MERLVLEQLTVVIVYSSRLQNDLIELAFWLTKRMHTCKLLRRRVQSQMGLNSQLKELGKAEDKA